MRCVRVRVGGTRARARGRHVPRSGASGAGPPAPPRSHAPGETLRALRALRAPQSAGSGASSPFSAVQAAQYSRSLVVKLIQSSRAMGTPKAPYMLFEAMPCI